MRVGRRVVAHHLVLSGYGFWLPNDPRGSGSEELREGKFADLGEVRFVRKARRVSREELRGFYGEAEGRLEFEQVWFDEGLRGVIGRELEGVVERCGYTVWACFVGANHVHLCVRAHRDSYETMWGNFAAQGRVGVVATGCVSGEHPVWGDRPNSRYLGDEGDVRRTIKYIEENADKEKLPRQRWGFVREFRGLRR